MRVNLELATLGFKEEDRLCGLVHGPSLRPLASRKADTSDEDATLLRKQPIVWKVDDNEK